MEKIEYILPLQRVKDGYDDDDKHRKVIIWRKSHAYSPSKVIKKNAIIKRNINH